MIFRIAFLIVSLIVVQVRCFGQQIKIESYEFISREDDTVQAELGSFKVLEDRNNESLDSIQLSFVRFKSTNPNPGNPIVYLSGGPGGSGVKSARGNRFKLFMKLREVADVIAFDQRGTGMSNQLPNCPYSIAFDIKKPNDKSEYIKKTTGNISKCLAFWQENSVNLGAYNTTENAKDIEALRNVLNVEKISLWGISYGSHLAFEYIRLYKDNVDKVVLASLEGPNETIKLPKKTEDFVFKIADLAKVKYPNLKEEIKAVHQRLKNKPIVTAYRNNAGIIDTIGFSNFELQSAISTFYLKNPINSKKLPKLYHQMYNGDFTEVASQILVVKRFLYRNVRPMSFAMDMQSGISNERKIIVSEQIDKSILGSTINFLMYEWMDKLNYSMLPKEFRKLKKSNINTLLLSGSMDGRTYLSDAKEIAKKFKNAKHIIIENAGHDLYMSSSSVEELVLDFFIGKKINKKSICLDPITFD